MPAFGPIKRSDLIRNLRKLGFEGPYTGGKHQYMVRGEVRVVLPNPHQGDISRDLLARILRQAGISREEWVELYQSQGQSLQLPPSCRFPPLREGNRVGRVGSVPPACRGNIKEGVIGHTRFCELWLRDWYYSRCERHSQNGLRHSSTRRCWSRGMLGSGRRS